MVDVAPHLGGDGLVTAQIGHGSWSIPASGAQPAYARLQEALSGLSGSANESMLRRMQEQAQEETGKKILQFPGSTPEQREQVRKLAAENPEMLGSVPAVQKEVRLLQYRRAAQAFGEDLFAAYNKSPAKEGPWEGALALGQGMLKEWMKSQGIDPNDPDAAVAFNPAIERTFASLEAYHANQQIAYNNVKIRESFSTELRGLVEVPWSDSVSTGQLTDLEKSSGNESQPLGAGSESKESDWTSAYKDQAANAQAAEVSKLISKYRDMGVPGREANLLVAEGVAKMYLEQATSSGDDTSGDMWNFMSRVKVGEGDFIRIASVNDELVKYTREIQSAAAHSRALTEHRLKFAAKQAEDDLGNRALQIGAESLNANSPDDIAKYQKRMADLTSEALRLRVPPADIIRLTKLFGEFVTATRENVIAANPNAYAECMTEYINRGDFSPGAIIGQLKRWEGYFNSGDAEKLYGHMLGYAKNVDSAVDKFFYTQVNILTGGNPDAMSNLLGGGLEKDLETMRLRAAVNGNYLKFKTDPSWSKLDQFEKQARVQDMLDRVGKRMQAAGGKYTEGTNNAVMLEMNPKPAEKTAAGTPEEAAGKQAMANMGREIKSISNAIIRAREEDPVQLVSIRERIKAAENAFPSDSKERSDLAEIGNDYQQSVMAGKKSFSKWAREATYSLDRLAEDLKKASGEKEPGHPGQVMTSRPLDFIDQRIEMYKAMGLK